MSETQLTNLIFSLGFLLFELIAHSCMHTNQEKETKEKTEAMPRAQPNVTQSYHTLFTFTLKPVEPLSLQYLLQ